MSRAVFVQGSTLRHLLVMTGASTLSLLAIFSVDLVDMFFLSLLGEQELAASVGFAGALLFFAVSSCIGLAIAAGALVARSLGANDEVAAGRYLTHVGVTALALTTPLALLGFWFAPTLLELMGAEGRTLELGVTYLRILLPSTPILALAMGCNAALRALGDPRRATLAMVLGSLVNAALDPIFIFVLDGGVAGAAWASVCSRVTIFWLAFGGIVRAHGLIQPFKWAAYRQDLAAISRIAGPALMTNIATPIGGIILTTVMAGYGDGAVAAAAVINRLQPVAFCALFALSGAVGPIIGQNYGAQRLDRVRSTLVESVGFVALYVAVVYLFLLLGRDWIASIFSLEGEAFALVVFYCLWLVPSVAFNGMSFAANAAFNNLNAATYATGFNLAKELLGTLPLVLLGSALFGASGALGGRAVAFVVVGSLSMVVALRLVERRAKASALAFVPDDDQKENATSLV